MSPKSALIVLALLCNAREAAWGQSLVCVPDATWVHFGHDTYGYLLTPPHKGPSQPCQVMKAATEGVPLSYMGVRSYSSHLYSRATLPYDKTITVSYVQHFNTAENNALVPDDFTFWYPNCNSTLVPSSGTFLIPFPGDPGCSGQGCATVGNPLIQIVSGDLGWEPPELVRVIITGADSDHHNVSVASQNWIGGWVIQDQVESSSLFVYPNPLPAQDTQVGFTIQLGTSLPSSTGYLPVFSNLDFKDHVNQNYPCAASEVVAESSYLEFGIALLDENAASPSKSVLGVAAPCPYDLVVTFAFLSTPTWNHYAVEGPLTTDDDFDLQVKNPSTGIWSPIVAVAGDYQVTIPANQSVAWLRFHANDNDFFPLGNESLEIAHLRIKSKHFTNIPAPPPSFLPYVAIGWSSDFRFVIQENGHCPF